MLAFLLAVVVASGAGGRLQAAEAQTLGGAPSRFNNASVYRYADPDDVTMRVNVWGAVLNPGIYEVPQGTRLTTLFSAAGGPNLQVRQRSDSQTIQVTLERPTEHGRVVVYQETMRDEIVVPDENPALQEGDVLTVQSYIREGFNWRDFLTIGTSFASLILTAVNIATR